MITRTTRHGFIVPLVMLLIACGMAVVFSMLNQGLVFSAYARTITVRRQARMLALSGIQVAFSLLSQEEVKKEATASSLAQKDNQKPTLLSSLLPINDVPQTLTFTTKQAGFDGTINLMIGCEQGKIPINEWFDWDKKKFKGVGAPAGDLKKLLIELLNKIPKLKGESLANDIEKTLREAGAPILDPSELLGGSEMATVFGSRQFPNIDDVKTITLFDIFTTVPQVTKIQPYFLSRGICTAIGCTLQSKDKKSEPKFQQSWQWPGAWDQLFTSLYGVTGQQLPKNFTSTLATSFDPTLFYVVSYGRVGSTIERIYLIVERIVQQKDNKRTIQLITKRFYWY